MPRLSVVRPHRLGQAEALARIERAAGKLAARFGARCTWLGPSLRIEHPGIRATVDVGAEEVAIEAELGGALGLLQRRAATELARLLDRELAA